MRIVIEHQGVARVIDGDFAICLSKEDRQTIVDALRREEEAVVYGWIEIREPLERTPNNSPIPWTQ